MYSRHGESHIIRQLEELLNAAERRTTEDSCMQDMKETVSEYKNDLQRSVIILRSKLLE